MGRKPNIELRFITPEIAEKMYSTSRQSRIDKRKLEEYMNAMKNGEWDYKNEKLPIIVKKEENGERLFNGNHRIKAVIESKISNWFNVEIR